MDDVALNYRWVVPFRLGGMKNPARTSNIEAAIKYLKDDLAVSTLVSLTDTNRADERDIATLNLDKLMQHRWYNFEFPMTSAPEGGVTTLIDIAETIHLEIRAGRNVAVHSGAGIGRAGTALAAYLVWAHKDKPMPDLLERALAVVTHVGKAPMSPAHRELLTIYAKKLL